MSKGSKRRPKQISDEEEQARWDAIFKGRVSEVVQDSEMAADEAQTAQQRAILRPMRGGWAKDRG